MIADHRISATGTSRSTERAAWTEGQRERFDQELLDLFAQQAAEVPVPVLLVALVIAALVWTSAAPIAVILWILAVATMLMLRRQLLPRLARRTSDSASRRVRLAILTSVGSGIVHAAAIWLFFPDLDVLQRALLTMVMVGLISGAVAILAGHLPSFGAYAAPILFSLAAWWVFWPAGSLERWWFEPAVGLLTLSLGLVITRFAILSQQLLRRAFAAGLAEEEARRHAEAGWHEAEVQLRRAEEASQAKTRFLSAASHDLRQPLQAMQWLGDSLVDAERADRQVIVERMSEAIESLEGLLKKLLDRSQLDAGVVRPDISVFELAPLIDQVQRDSEAHARIKRLTLSIRCQSRVFVCSDRTLLLSVFRNLLENTIKYTDLGGAEITVEQRDGVVKVCITDTGRGIPEHERERVFEEFYQLDNRQRDASRGFGLGLSIVRGYCDLLGIKLALASPPGGGTSVELTLEQANPEEFPSTQEVAQVGDPELFRGLRVLITEDDARVLEAECTLLRARGCDVSAARTVAEATQLVTSDSFDLLVTDYRLPDGSGFDVIHALESVQLDPPAVLFVTGDTGAAELRAMSDSGYECLTKPVKLVPLLRAMNRALIRKENLRAESPRDCA